MNRHDAFMIPPESQQGQQIRLSRPISALQLIAKEDGTATIGSVAHLEPDSSVEVCGSGFNEQTVRIHANGDFYFAFRSDIIV